MEQEIKALEEAYALEPRRWEANTKSKVGIQSILKEIEKTTAPPDFTEERSVFRAYDKDGNIIRVWPVDSVSIEYF